MSKSIVVKLDAKKVANRIGLLPGGKVHRYAMDRIAFHMKQYLAAKEYMSLVDAMQQGMEYENARIVFNLKYAAYLYYGKVMAGNPRKPTGVDLRYTKSPHPKAGPFWDKQVMQNDMPKIAKEVAEYIKKG